MTPKECVSNRSFPRCTKFWRRTLYPALAMVLVGWVPGGDLLAQSPQPTQCEMQVNVEPHYRDLAPVATYGADGRLLVVFGGVGIKARLFETTGEPLGDLLEVDSMETPYYVSAKPVDVALDSNGEYWIVWAGQENLADEVDIFARRLAADGTFASGRVRLNSFTADSQEQPRVASNTLGSVFVWSSEGQDGSGVGIFTRRAAADHTLGGTQQVNLHTTSDQLNPAVASNDAGEFLVVWHGAGADDGDGVFARRLASDGTPMGAEMRVNVDTLNEEVTPTVIGNGNDFLVAWSSRPAIGDLWEVVTRSVTASGPTGSETQISNGSDDRSGLAPELAELSTGEFVIAWNDWNAMYGEYTSHVDSRIQARLLDAAGVPTAADFQVNVSSLDCLDCYRVHRPDVAAGPTGGEIALVWVGKDDSEGLAPIALQRLEGPSDTLPADLSVSLSENSDPIDNISLLRYELDIANKGYCAADNVTLTQQLPPEVTPFSLGTIGGAWTCEFSGQTVLCDAASLPRGDSTIIATVEVPEVSTTLFSSAQISADNVDPRLEDNQDIETTEVVRCFNLSRQMNGGGLAPVLNPNSIDPCAGNRYPLDAALSLTSEPRFGGWRVGSWSGTEDDGSSSRFNTLTMPAADHEVTVNYTFDGLISWWPAGADLTDLADNNPLAYGNGPLSIDSGFEGSGFLFDGDDFLQAQAHASLDLGTGDFTIGYWLATTEGSGVQSILDRRAAGPTRGIHTFLSDGRPGIQLADGVGLENFIATASIADDALHQVLFTVDRDRADGLRIYIDGKLDSVFDPRGIAGSLDNDAELLFGRRAAAFGADAFYMGMLDEPFLVARALDSSQRIDTLDLAGRWLASGGTSDDSSAYENHGLLEGDVSYISGACAGSAFRFGEAGGALRMPYDPTLQASEERLTWAFWLRVDPDNGNGPLRVLRHGSTVDRRGYELLLTGGTPVLRMLNGSLETYPSGLPNLRDGEWHFLALVIEGGNTKTATFYLDDRQPTTHDLSSVFGLGDNTSDIVFGSTAFDRLDADIDDIHYFRRALARETIEAVRERCIPPLFGDGFESGDLTAWSSSFNLP